VDRIAMYETHSNIELNYLLIVIRGRLDRASAEALVASFAGHVQKLRPGFSIINDLSEARPAHDDVVQVMKAGQHAMFVAGAARVIRVIADGSAASSLQFSRTQREMNVGYEARVVPTMAEALRVVKTSARGADRAHERVDR
jgi:hypothetical protein